MTVDGRSVAVHSGTLGRINSPVQVSRISVFDPDFKPLSTTPAGGDHPEPTVTVSLEPEYGDFLGFTADGTEFVCSKRGEG